ncbi:MAG: pyridoxamine 5'-phosphate oxidase family protein [Deltaproteobacteria bacterium]|nr:pyridoxamine 5'-phosphate oxidase family protein [Deltaproteobacteria bacterium]
MSDLRDNPKLAKLAVLIDGITTAMLTTVDQDGAVRSRPMLAPELQEDGTVWFFTSASSGKVQDVALEPKVNITYADERSSTFVSLSGDAELVHDKARMAELWKPELADYFRDGVDDPDLALLRVDLDSADYWDVPLSQLVRVEGLSYRVGRESSSDEIGPFELQP